MKIIKDIDGIQVKYYKKLIPDFDKTLRDYELSCGYCRGKKTIEAYDSQGQLEFYECRHCSGKGIEKHEKLLSDFRLKTYAENANLVKCFCKSEGQCYILRNIRNVKSTNDLIYFITIIPIKNLKDDEIGEAGIFYYVDKNLEKYTWNKEWNHSLEIAEYCQPIFVSGNKEYFKSAVTEYFEYLNSIQERHYLSLYGN